MQESLKTVGNRRTVPAVATQRLQASMAQDIRELLPHLEQRGQATRADAEKLLVERGRIESEALRGPLEDQRRRVLAKYKASEQDQLYLPMAGDTTDAAERRQRAADRRHWESWLANVEGDLTREPQRIAEFYQTKSFRLEPVGLAYLWPVTG